MALTKEVTQREVRVSADGVMQSHETHTILEDGVAKGTYNHVRVIQMEDAVDTESELVQDLSVGVRTTKRLSEKAAKDAQDAAATPASIPTPEPPRKP